MSTNFDQLDYASMTPGQKAAYTKRMQKAGLVSRTPSRSRAYRAPTFAPELAEIEALARTKMTEHGLTDLGWRFAWDNAPTRGGRCKFKKSGEVWIGTITLSRPLFSKPENRSHALNTILHEIAHALAGPKHGHDWHWRLIARRIGCNGNRCHTMKADAKWVADCTCGVEHTRIIKPKSVRLCAVTKQPLEWRPA